MQPKTLELAPVAKVVECKGNLMGFSETKNKELIKVYDNWVNRIVMNYPLRYNEVAIPFSNERQVETFDKLFDFQKHDARAMAGRDFYLNRNKMGAGKTIETIATCILLNAESILICCPKTLRTQWVAQFKAWWPERATDVKCYEFGYTPQRGDILLLNPEKLISSKARGMFNRFVWDVLAVDEAHMIKNRSTKRTVAVKQIPAKHKYALTGTPVLKHPDDLYSIFEFLNPDIVGSSYWRFTEYFCNVVESFYGKQIAGLTDNPQHVAILQDILAHVSCYHDTSVKGVKRQIFVPLTMDAKQSKLYKQILKVQLEELPENITIPNGAVKSVRLLQTTGCPKVLDSGVAEEAQRYTEGVKFEYILELLQNNPDLKVVIFSKYAQIINHLKAYLLSNSIDIATYTGQQSDEIRLLEKKHFINSGKCRVLAGTIDSLGTGVDGLQEVCHVCIFIDHDTRPSINEQCEARLFRTGQKEEVLCYYLKCENTIDNHMTKLNNIRAEDLRRLLEEGL